MEEGSLPSVGASSSFTIASFNAHWGIGRRRREAGERYDVAEAIRALDADVVAVPESFRYLDGRGVLDPLRDDGYALNDVHITRLKDHRAFDDVRPEGDWSLAICSRLPVLDLRPLPIGHFPTDPAGFRHALQLVVDVGGTPVVVTAVHTSSKVWFGAPLWHLRNLRKHLPPLDVPAVVAGDCNFWGPGVVSVLRGWRRAVRGRTYPAHRPHSQIDHILVSRRVETVGASIHRVGLSDHRAVRAELRILTPQER